jgi:hypothetical protein
MNEKNVHDFEEALAHVQNGFASHFERKNLAMACAVTAFVTYVDHLFFHGFNDARAWRILTRWGARRPS